MTAHAREASILAAAVYLCLIRIPGHAHVQFFHPVIFQKSLDTLKNIFLIDQKGENNHIDFGKFSIHFKNLILIFEQNTIYLSSKKAKEQADSQWSAVGRNKVNM